MKKHHKEYQYSSLYNLKIGDKYIRTVVVLNSIEQHKLFFNQFIKSVDTDAEINLNHIYKTAFITEKKDKTIEILQEIDKEQQEKLIASKNLSKTQKEIPLFPFLNMHQDN